MESKYNVYGKLIGTVPDNIIKGDLVSYKDSKTIMLGKSRKRVHVILKGEWDGEKVEFNDTDKTVVRTIHWLTKLQRCKSCGHELNF